MKTEFLDLRLADCMDMMKEFPDNRFDLAIVDPPYGISARKTGMGACLLYPFDAADEGLGVDLGVRGSIKTNT